MKLDPLLKSREPWLHLLVATESDACNALWAMERSTTGRAVCRAVRGHKATIEAAFFDEAAAAWQFPYYFGENWDAFEECLADLEWLPADAYFFCVIQGIHLLEKEPEPQRRQFFSVLGQVTSEWGKATPSRPFHVLLQCTEKEQASLENRLRAAGVAHDVFQ